MLGSERLWGRRTFFWLPASFVGNSWLTQEGKAGLGSGRQAVFSRVEEPLTLTGIMLTDRKRTLWNSWKPPHSLWWKQSLNTRGNPHPYPWQRTFEHSVWTRFTLRCWSLGTLLGCLSWHTSSISRWGQWKCLWNGRPWRWFPFLQRRTGGCAPIILISHCSASLEEFMSGCCKMLQGRRMSGPLCLGCCYSGPW